MFAITSFGVGKEVTARAIQPDWPLVEGEVFKVDSWKPGMVLAEDGVSLRDPLPEDETPAVPASCSRRQGRLAMLANGLLDDVEALIAAIPDDTQRRAAQIEYEADTWERSNATLQAMWAQLNGTTEGLDDLFSLAVTL